MPRAAIITILLCTCVGCVSIPAESVDLSRRIGEMITTAKISHMNMVDRYFDESKAKVEDFAFHEYKDSYLRNVRKIKKRKDPNFAELSFDEYDRAMSRVQHKRDELVQVVNSNRHTILSSLEEHYDLMSHANASLTALLESGAKLRQSETAFLDKFGPRIGLSSNKLKELEDKLLEGTNKLRSLMDGTLESLKESE